MATRLEVIYLTLIILLLSNSFVCKKHIYEDKDCRYEVNGKIPGNVSCRERYMVINGTPNKTLPKISDSEKCNEECINDLDCQMSDFDNKSCTCNLYHEIFELQSNYSHNVFIWKFCNLSRGVYTKEGVPGIWLYRLFVRLKSNLTTLSWPDCRTACLNNKLCGGFNVHIKTNSCELLELWITPSKVDFTEDKHSLVFFWMPQKSYKYRIRNEVCRNIQGKECTGKWEIYYKKSEENFFIVSKFHTRDFQLCWRSCEYYSQCNGVMFEHLISSCVLKSSKKIRCSKKKAKVMKDTINVRWFCCKNSTVRNHLTIKSNFFNFVCRKIKYPMYVALIPLKCEYPRLSIKENCTTEIKKHSNNCYKQQSFLSTNTMVEDSIKVFNGYEGFLIKNATYNNFPNSSFESCQLYNASIPHSPIINITKFKDWYPIRDYKNYGKLILPVKYVIVEAKNPESCLCYAWLQCVEILRFIQIRYEIPQNFIIGPNGDIFENRGWYNHSNYFNSSYQQKVLYILFLGNFKINNATVASLSAFRNLIAFAVDHKYINKKYILLTYDDFRGKKDISKKENSLYNIIRTQPRYNGYTRASCRNTLILNGVLILVVSLLLLFFACYIFNLIHSTSCTLLRKERFHKEITLTEVYGFTKESIIYLKYSSNLKDFIINNTVSIMVENTSFFWITERRVPPCSYCYKYFQEFFRLSRIKQCLVKMKNLEEISKCCKYETLCLIFWPQTFLCKITIIIFHLNNESMYFNFQNILSSIISNKCICTKYTLCSLNTDLKEKVFATLLC